MFDLRLSYYFAVKILLPVKNKAIRDSWPTDKMKKSPDLFYFTLNFTSSFNSSSFWYLSLSTCDTSQFFWYSNGYLGPLGKEGLRGTGFGLEYINIQKGEIRIVAGQCKVGWSITTVTILTEVSVKGKKYLKISARN